MSCSVPEVLSGSQTLPATAQLLISDGDARILLDPASGLNKYGCKPTPDAALLAFGSSTATTISAAGFAAVNQLRERLLQETGSLEKNCARETQRIRLELLELTGLSDLDVELRFAASGTDAHLIAARYAAAGQALKVVMVEADETGSGVQAVLSAVDPNCVAVSLRASDGAPRLAGEIDAEVAALTKQAVIEGQRVLLIMADQSKTGLIAPGPGCVMQLYQQHPDQVAVLVDACQFRITPATFRAYLQQGFMVALTGSKFFAGPSFSAALLLPEKVRQNRPSAEACLTPGLLLRWEAALFELRRFCAVRQDFIADYLENFAKAVQLRLIDDRHFEPLTVPALDRRPLTAVQSWDTLPTIFPFLLYRSTASGRVPLGREETALIYGKLQVPIDSAEKIAALRCQFGQPVACGSRDGIAVSALRLCISARQISDAAEQQGISGVIEEAMAALDKAAWLVDRFVNGKP